MNMDPLIPPCPSSNKSLKPHYYFLMNNIISNHTITTRNSYRNKTQVKTTPCTRWSSTPILHHHQQYTPINTMTLYQPPRPQYWTHPSTYKNAFTDGMYDLPIYHTLRQCSAFLENFQGNILRFYTFIFIS